MDTTGTATWSDVVEAPSGKIQQEDYRFKTNVKMKALDFHPGVEREAKIQRTGLKQANCFWRSDMAKNTLYLFPDTDLFIQCLPLEQL